MGLPRIAVLTSLMTHAVISYLSKGSSGRLLVRAFAPTSHVHKSRQAVTTVLAHSGAQPRPFLSATRAFASSLGSTVEKADEDLDAALDNILKFNGDKKLHGEGSKLAVEEMKGVDAAPGGDPLERNHVQEQDMKGSKPMPTKLVEKVRN